MLNRAVGTIAYFDLYVIFLVQEDKDGITFYLVECGYLKIKIDVFIRLCLRCDISVRVRQHYKVVIIPSAGTVLI